jgi:hypothetical protein
LAGLLIRIKDAQNVTIRITMKTQQPIYKSYLLIVLMLAIGISGCNQVKLAYNYSDWYFAYQIDQYLDLNDKQEAFIDKQIAALHQWHKDNELPLIIQYLKKSKTELENKLTAEFIFEMEQVAEDMKKRLVSQIIDDLIALVISLNDKQIEHFDTALKSDIKEHTEASDISEEEWMMVKDEKKIEDLNDWFGDLSEAQETTLLAIRSYSKNDHERNITYMTKFQRKLVMLLYQRKDNGELRATLSQWITNPDSQRTNDEIIHEINQRDKTRYFWQVLDQIITEKQRKHALGKLQTYIDDLESISI